MSADQTKHHVPTPTTAAGPRNVRAGSTDPARSERLSALADATPKFKSGQIRGLWPQITDALARGHKLKQIWECLNNEGLAVSYSRFRHIVADLKRSHAAGGKIRARSQRPIQLGGSTETPEIDPAANLRERLNNRSGFHWDESPRNLKKLVGNKART